MIQQTATNAVGVTSVPTGSHQYDPVPRSLPQQAAATSSYAGLNLMFIVDQSGSMGGEPYGQQTGNWGDGNDPYGFRFEGPIYGLEWLDSFAGTLTLPSGQEPPKMNLALIAFGSDTRLILDWTEIGADQGATAWQDLRSDLAVDMSHERFKSDPNQAGYNLGLTDFQAAFEHARAVFQQAPSATSGQQNLNAIVLLTDGGPCTQDACTTQHGLLHLSGVRDQLTSYFPSYEVFIVAIDKDDRYWTTYESKWAETVCGSAPCPDPLHLKRIITFDELVAHFNDVLVNLANIVAPGSIISTTVQIPPGLFNVPPYRQILRLNVFKAAPGPLPGGNVALYYGANPVTPTVISGSSSVIEKYEVQDPLPGEWRIDVNSPSGIDEVTFITNVMSVGLNGETTTSDPIKYQPVEFTLNVVNRSGQTIARYPNNEYPLTFEVAIYNATDPTLANRQQITTVTVADNSGQPDLHSYTGSWIPMEAGNYEVRASATYIDPATQQPTFLFEELSAIDPLVVGETSFEHLGLSVNNQSISSAREDETFTVTTLVKNKVTNSQVAWDTSHIALEVLVVDAQTMDTQNPFFSQVYNNPTSNGVLTGSLLVDEPGDYVVMTQAGMLDPQGAFVPLDDLGGQFPLNVRPLHPLAFELSVIPSDPTVEAQKPGPFPRPWSNASVSLQISLRDELTGQLASLEQVTGGKEALPVVRVGHDGDFEDISDRLTESPPGRYVVELTNLGMGDYTFSVQSNTPENELTNGDYVWNRASARVAQQRNLALFIPISIGVILVIIGLLIMSTIMYRQIVVKRRQFPVSGTLEILVRRPDSPDGELEVFHTVNLDTFGLNRVILHARQLKPPFELIEVSTRQDEQLSENGTLYVERVKFNGAMIEGNTLPSRLDRGSDFYLTEDPEDGSEFVLAKDIGETFSYDNAEVSLSDLW